MKGRNIDMNKKKEMKIEQMDTYGVGYNRLISIVKVGKTTFVVSSYFESGKPFSDAMDNVIENKIKAS